MSQWISDLRSDVAGEFAGKPVVITLATVDASGRPRARSVVCRAIADGGGIWFTSHRDADKVAHLAGNPLAEGVVWLPTLRRQYRLLGPVRIVPRIDPDVTMLWTGMSPTSRAMFTWPAPGQPRVAEQEYLATYAEKNPPGAFAVLELIPDLVERLDVRTSPHDRVRWRQSNGWAAEPLTP